MIYGYENLITIVLAIAGFGIVIWAQIMINNAYSQQKKRKSNLGLSGCEVAKKILDANGLSNIYVVETNGELSDHYDPSRKVVRLSRDIFHGTSIASLSIAAHECGHAIQDKDGYTFMRIRAALVPTVNFITYLGYFALIISLFAGITGYLYISLGIILVALIFQLVTLPVEFDASRRAMQELEKLSIITPDEKTPSEAMLKAAAMTYVASLISMILNLLRIFIMLRNRD